MADNLTHKILKEHLVDGELKPGTEIGIRIDQTLTQDATGTMAYLQFEAMGLDRVKTKRSVSYVDHNMLQTGFENADDHLYLQTVAANYGIDLSKPGNGVCHQVHLERFGVPGMTLLGSDSHTPTNGGLGMIAIGAGGLDVAVAMGGGAFYLPCPGVVGVRVTGKLQPWVSGKDVILEVLRLLTVKGGVGNVIEYFGEGVKSLTLTQRATITNMGAELGATCSIFPSDEQTLEYLTAQSRAQDYRPLAADPGATYDKVVEIDLDKLEPMIAKPHSPDSVVTVREVAGTKVQQVCIGSCTNSSLYDLEITAAILKGKNVSPDLSLTITPGSKQVYKMMADSGALATTIASGARILESACGPCIGMGQAPASGSVSVRSFNRNFEGRSGTKDSFVYLASPETCAATALAGVITDPRSLGAQPILHLPAKFYIDDRGIIPPAGNGDRPKIARGPNIKPLPTRGALPDKLTGTALLKLGDNITTDHIMPAGAKILPLRSNIPAISEFVFFYVDQTFPKRAKEAGSFVVVGGENYGQGSSREHAALAPMYLGLQFVLAKSFARIHKTNLVNFGILPLTFGAVTDYERLNQGDKLEILDVRNRLKSGNRVTIKNLSQGYDFEAQFDLSSRQVDILLAGGLLNYTRGEQEVMSNPKLTPFTSCHNKAGAKMVEFAGYLMPIQYHSIQEEHLRVRKTVGIFDLSHMGEFFVKGEGALEFLQKMTTNDVAALRMHQVQYCAMCYPHGGIVDDLLVYRLPDEYMLVVNAANIDKDLAWLMEHKPAGVELVNRTDEFGLLAIQGPKAAPVMAKLTDFDSSKLGYYESAYAKICGKETLFSRTGYTGEDGFEIYCAPQIAQRLWDQSVEAGREFDVEPIGLGARDSLRLEMRYMLYGNDIDQTTNPIEAGLGWICKPEKGEFIGKAAIVTMKQNKPLRRLQSLVLKEKAIPRHGYAIHVGSESVGQVTSGCFSPSLEAGIALGYVDAKYGKLGETVDIEVRGKRYSAEVIKGAFYKNGSHI